MIQEFNFYKKSNVMKTTVKVPLIGSQDFWDISSRKSDSLLLKAVNNEKIAEKCDAELISNIDQVYFNSSDFDFAKFELEKLPRVLDKKLIASDVKKLRVQHEIVEKQLLQLILENQAACDDELDKIGMLQTNLKSSIENCEHAKNRLKLAKRQITTAGLGLLGNCRKKSLILDLLNSLNSIKMLLQTEKKLEELVSQSDYAKGIALLLECTQGASSFKQFTCIAALSVKLQDALIMTEEQLDIVLSNICFNFDKEKYSAVQEAYRRLGKTRIAIDQLHMHYTSAVHSTSFDTINLFVNSDKVENNKNSFALLCQCVPDEQLIPCLIALSKIFWNILQSYKNAADWHREFKDISTDSEVLHWDGKLLPDSTGKQIVDRLPIIITNNGSEQLLGVPKLLQGTSKVQAEAIYQCLAERGLMDYVKAMCSYTTVSKTESVKFVFFDDEISDNTKIKMVLALHIKIGEEFCNSKSEQLQNDTKKSCISYFHAYHKNCLDELTIFFENESWTPCPVKREFNLFQLQYKDIKYLFKTVAVAVDLRKPVYGRVICKSIDYNQVLSMMIKVNWEVKDIMCEHSRYVDYFLQEIRAFFKTLKTSTSNIYLNEQVLNSIWEAIAVLVSSVFIEGFSLAKKCSNAGRALMQLDFTQFLSQINSICPLNPLPHKELIEVYIKAYYLPETSLETWIRDHQEYTHKQLLAVINCVCQNNKRSRQKLTNLLEESLQR
ncbi:PREDICTED: syndetin-like [Diuraphis noxia]|uniref:syndetin-like n=1 Tax=Diuraphis noxia TaxID=143948 RepID=UPI00076374C4|nr:PREDICTED: syndetin-like [Diuraphis noxia]